LFQLFEFSVTSYTYAHDGDDGDGDDGGDGDSDGGGDDDGDGDGDDSDDGDSDDDGGDKGGARTKI